jgi:hypothetical protein
MPGLQLWVCALSAIGSSVRADVITDWADTTTAIATDGPNTLRTMALAQSAVYEAVNAISTRYPRDRVDLGDAQRASADAAVAAASHAILLATDAALKPQIDAAFAQALAKIESGDARTKGLRIGEGAAADVLSKHRDDLGTPEPYRPFTAPGIYVPTTFPQGYTYAQHKPWVLKTSVQFRPPPPPALKSAVWARDYNEIKSIGSASSSTRTPEQTDIARFWASSLPDVYVNVVRSVATGGGRDLTRNARLYAAVTAGMNDAEIAVQDAKYHYNFWRPITAIRNGDRDDNPATDRDADWSPVITTPLNPEYPCGNCVYAAMIVIILRAEAGGASLPVLSTISNTAPGVTRRWPQPDDMVREVSLARIYAGVHFRTSTEVGNRMGEQVGQWIADAYGLH